MIKPRLSSDNLQTRVSVAQSPRRSPTITQALRNPPRSLHPTLHQDSSYMLSLDAKTEVDHESQSYLVAESDCDDALDMGKENIEARHSIEGSRSVSPDIFQPTPTRNAANRMTFPIGPDHYHMLHTEPDLTSRLEHGVGSTTSRDDSSNEQSIYSHDSPQHIIHLQKPVQRDDTAAQRHSSVVERSSIRQYPASDKMRQVLGAHAIAHEIALQALLRDKEALKCSVRAVIPVDAKSLQSSLLPRTNLVRRTPDLDHNAQPIHDLSHPFQKPATPKPASDQIPILHGANHTRTSTSMSTSSLPLPQPIPTTPLHSTAPHLLVLTIQRRRSSTSPRSITTLAIPASNDYSIPGHSTRHTARFDDAQLFSALHRAYATLIPWPARWFAARKVCGLVVSGRRAKEAVRRYEGENNMLGVSSAYPVRGTGDVVGEKVFGRGEVWRMWCDARVGRARYAFVGWVRVVAGAAEETARKGVVEGGRVVSGGSGGSGSGSGRREGEGDGEEVRQEKEMFAAVEREEAVSAGEDGEVQGLEFIMGWSIRRIAIAAILVIMLACAAAVLWILLGKNTSPGDVLGGGFRDAGDRVSAGVLLGICVLLVGLSMLAGWLGISWLMI